MTLAATAPGVLHAVPARVGGGSVAARVAARRLAMLGCAVEPAAAPGCAARLSIDGVLSTVDWAGPVALPLADEASVQAACGIMHVHGRRYGRPTSLRVAYASTVAGILGVQAALAMLVSRARGGSHGRATTSVAQGALLALAPHLADATADDPPAKAAPGGPPFVSADGVRFEIETLRAEAWQRFWAALGADPVAVRRGWPPFERRFATAACPLPPALHAATEAFAYKAVAACADASGVSIMPVRSDAVPATEPPWRLASTGLAGPGSWCPPGAAPLSGIVVVEAGRRVQGPLAAHLLRLLGARVVRVEPPGGDPMRGVPPMAGACAARFLALNHGKEVVELDLRTGAGRRAVCDLVADADAFLHNWAPGRAAEFGLDAPDLARVRPGLVYAHASGWGEALGTRPPIGTDYLVQAYSGVAAAATVPGRRAAPSLLTLADVLGGLTCAEGVLAGLYARAVTGQGQRVETSLLSAVVALLDAPHDSPQWSAEVPLCTDLAVLGADPRFAGALVRDACVLVGAPWTVE